MAAQSSDILSVSIQAGVFADGVTYSFTFAIFTDSNGAYDAAAATEAFVAYREFVENDVPQISTITMFNQITHTLDDPPQTSIWGTRCTIGWEAIEARLQELELISLSS